MAQLELSLGEPLMAMESEGPPSCSKCVGKKGRWGGGVQGERGGLKPWRLCSEDALSEQRLPTLVP